MIQRLASAIPAAHVALRHNDRSSRKLYNQQGSSLFFDPCSDLLRDHASIDPLGGTARMDQSCLRVPDMSGSFHLNQKRALLYFLVQYDAPLLRVNLVAAESCMTTAAVFT